MSRQIDFDRRALAGLGINLHVPPGLLDETEHLRQSQAGSFADILGCEEGFERLVDDGGRHACSGVADGLG